MKRGLGSPGGNFQQRTYKKQRPSKPSVSAGQIQQAVRKAILKTAETKYFDTVVANTNTIGGTTLIGLTSIAAGTDFNNRVGRHVHPKGMYVDYDVNGPVTVTASTDYGFVALVWDYQPDGSAAAFGDIFDVTSAPPGMAFKKISVNKDRFKVLWLEEFTVQNTTTLLGNWENTHNRKYYDLSKIPDNDVEWGTAAGAVPIKGDCIVAFGSVNNSGTAASASIKANVRFSYTDF